MAAERVRRSARGRRCRYGSRSQRNHQLTALGEPLAALLSAAGAIGAVSTVDTISHHVRKQDDSVDVLEMSALRAAAAPASGKRAPRTNAGFGVLAHDCAARLRSRLDRPFRAHDDWSIELPADGCTCELCVVLRGFLADPSRRTFEWPLAQERRRHVHSRIDGAELPVTHVTRRKAARPAGAVQRRGRPELARGRVAAGKGCGSGSRVCWNVSRCSYNQTHERYQID
jgi:hypothetical protein